MSIADRALACAVHMEVKKDGLQQRQSGDWVLRLTVQATDMPMEIMQASMGQRYIAVLVAVDDNEEPKKPTSAPEPAGPESEKPIKAVRVWSSLPPASQAAIIGSEAMFWSFVKERFQPCQISDAEEAAEFIRAHCGIDTRKQLATNTHARKRFEDLAADYRLWRDHPEMVA
jgi:hypothetical protein